MKNQKLGEFEEVILILVGILIDDAYALRITNEYKEQSGKSASIGTIHSTLERLVEKGFLTSEIGEPTSERGGRRKRVYSITAEGETILRETQQFRVSLWNQLPGFSIKDLSFARA